MMNILTDEIRDKVFSILTETLGNATGIYTTVADMNAYGEDEFYSTLTIEDGKPVGYGDIIEETDDLYIAHGASRITFIPRKANFVIKMPITAVWDWKVNMRRPADSASSEDEMEETSEWYSDFNEDYYTNDLGYEVISKEFCCYCERTDFDLMDSENALREEIKDINEEVAEIFLPNEYVGDYNGIPVWIQRRIQSTQCNTSSLLTPERRTAISQTFHNANLSADFIYSIMCEYGDDVAQEVVEIINELGINDLHDGNLGYLSTGEAVCFDYAGYDEENIWNFITV